MSAADRYEAARPLRPLAALTRPELTARAYVVQEVIDLLWDICRRDGGEPFVTIGRAKVELILLRNEVARDKAEAERWPQGALGNPAARERLQAAGSELSALVRDLATDGARSLGRRSA